jgi:hypothetical protein
MRESVRFRKFVVVAAAAVCFCARQGAFGINPFTEYASSDCNTAASCGNCLNGTYGVATTTCASGSQCVVWGGQGITGGSFKNCVSPTGGSSHDCVYTNGTNLTACASQPYWACGCMIANDPPPPPNDCTGQTCTCANGGTGSSGNITYTPQTGTCTSS